MFDQLCLCKLSLSRLFRFLSNRDTAASYVDTPFTRLRLNAFQV